jgi:hypothetical protein
MKACSVGTGSYIVVAQGLALPSALTPGEHELGDGERQHARGIAPFPSLLRRVE